MLHSTGFMAYAVYRPNAPPEKKIPTAAMFLFPYALLTLIASLAMKSGWPLISFWTLTLNRWAGPLLSASEGEERFREAMVGWIVSFAIYLVVICVGIFVPVPGLGLEGYSVAPGTFPDNASTSGREVTLAQAMAMGVTYFAVSGLSELFGHRWVPARWRRGTARPR